MLTGIIDIHGREGGTRDWPAFVRAGGLALIHKVSEGKDFIDRRWRENVAAARAGGVELVGLYHFGSSSSDGATQADWMLSCVGCDDARLVLDLETNPNGLTMTTAQAADFVSRIHERTGRWPLLYAGASDLRARARAASSPVLATLARCDLWLAQYGEPPRPGAIPSAWRTWSLWQYTNGRDGPRDQRAYPRATAGIGNVDRNAFNGDAAALRAWWQSAGRTPPSPTAPSPFTGWRGRCRSKGVQFRARDPRAVGTATTGTTHASRPTSSTHQQHASPGGSASADARPGVWRATRAAATARSSTATATPRPASTCSGSHAAGGAGVSAATNATTSPRPAARAWTWGRARARAARAADVGFTTRRARGAAPRAGQARARRASMRRGQRRTSAGPRCTATCARP